MSGSYIFKLVGQVEIGCCLQSGLDELSPWKDGQLGTQSDLFLAYVACVYS